MTEQRGAADAASGEKDKHDGPVAQVARAHA